MRTIFPHVVKKKNFLEKTVALIWKAIVIYPKIENKESIKTFNAGIHTKSRIFVMQQFSRICFYKFQFEFNKFFCI